MLPHSRLYTEISRTKPNWRNSQRSIFSLLISTSAFSPCSFYSRSSVPYFQNVQLCPFAHIPTPAAAAPLQLQAEDRCLSRIRQMSRTPFTYTASCARPHSRLDNLLQTFNTTGHRQCFLSPCHLTTVQNHERWLLCCLTSERKTARPLTSFNDMSPTISANLKIAFKFTQICFRQICTLRH